MVMSSLLTGFQDSEPIFTLTLGHGEEPSGSFYRRFF